jgi:lysophospholipase L1-like esterase
VPKAAAGLTAVALAVTALTGLPSSALAATTTSQYVAIGDSWAAGVGASPDDPAADVCRQNPDSYPKIWARNHPRFHLDDQTCSGATVESVRYEQMETLSAQTKLVTITVGGNDDAFIPTVTTCFTDTEERCKYETDYGAYKAVHWLADDLELLYDQVKEKAPNADIIVLGYPYLIDAGDGSCGLLTPDATRRSHLNNNAEWLAEGIKEASARADVTFVDMRSAFSGHEACSADPYIIGADGSKQMFHPNKGGHEVYACELQRETDLH